MAVVEFKQVTTMVDNSFKNFDLILQKGDFLVLAGLNAPLEKTFFQLLTGMQQPAIGQVLIEGKDIKIEENRTQAFQKIGVMSQENLQPALTVVENLTHIGHFQKNYSQVRQNHLLNSLKLLDVKQTAVKKLTAGERQRLALASALLNNPELLILVNPLHDLTAKESESMLTQLAHEKKTGKTILLTCEHFDQAAILATELAIVKNGQLLITESQRELQKKFTSFAEFEEFYARAKGLSR